MDKCLVLNEERSASLSNPMVELGENNACLAVPLALPVVPFSMERSHPCIAKSFLMFQVVPFLDDPEIDHL